MKRLLFIISIISLMALSGQVALVGQNSGSGATPSPDHVTLTWTQDPATTVTVTWRTDTTVATGFVLYQAGDALSSNAQRKDAAWRNFTTNLGEMRLFTATLTGLCSNTKYNYRVGDGEHWSETRTFSTADPQSGSFKFLVFGDSQSPIRVDSPYADWRATVQNAYKANPDARFMVNVGDLVDFGQSYEHWNAWFDAASGVIDSIPIMPVTGNHESYGSRDTMRPAYWSAQFRLPQNGPDDVKNQAYSYDYGPVHFVVLDSQQFEQQKYGDILTPQAKWLDADLKATQALWKIVFLHRPPYEIKPNRTNEEIKQAFCPVLDRHHVDLVFSAHDHGISRTHAIRGGAFMPVPSMGTVYYISGRSGHKVYPDVEKRPWNTFFYNPEDQPNYFVIEVDGCKITIQTVMRDGTILDSFFIDKEKDISSDTPYPFSDQRSKVAA